MRNVEQVYLVKLEEGSSGYYVGEDTSGSLTKMTLLCGNKVMVIDDVLIAETDADSIAEAWGENEEMLESGEADCCTINDVTDEEADVLWAERIEEEEDC